MGLTPVASTLPSCPYGVTGFLTATSPPSPDAEVETQEETEDREALNPILIKEVVDQQDQVALMEISEDDGALAAAEHAMVQATLTAPPCRCRQGLRAPGHLATVQDFPQAGESRVALHRAPLHGTALPATTRAATAPHGAAPLTTTGH
ncbi:hypothetical protein GUJ93_ZPchr0014g47431 [Zizania palustris]|uniref:Uncharacterized protein n=1 Tax=Zizania palustris TaxID=103762 RepID=A0A8J5TL02_ZIZPA|nr:hypothetical protein GUJ93_ZPchr0014g47431 [Zizania palustris]